MIKFVNAKINLGLDIVARRPDGYHDLQTVFYPVGVLSGTPRSPWPFSDILEATPGGTEDRLLLTGRKVDCLPERNLVWRALRLYRERLSQEGLSHRLAHVSLTLEKHLPDGAGLGGGSADATFTLEILEELSGNALGRQTLSELALSLGADCPFFLLNRCAYAEGVGERLESLPLSLAGMWCVIVKPPVSISTARAFAGVTPARPVFSLRKLSELPVSEWRGVVKNDFEQSLFPQFPQLAEIKEALYGTGALYASMSGSGSSLYGLFADYATAVKACECWESTDRAVWLLLLT